VIPTIDEMFREAQDHLAASSILSFEPEDAQAVVTSMMTSFRHQVSFMRAMALVLRRQPAMADRVAESLEKLADELAKFVYADEDEDAAA
jgi:hypothetical protein